jgi:hypothetical protein
MSRNKSGIEEKSDLPPFRLDLDPISFENWRAAEARGLVYDGDKAYIDPITERYYKLDGTPYEEQ